MKLPVTPELTEILVKILGENKSETEWAQIESDDWFQSPHFRGGFDATEMAFCFSYYDEAGSEFWFQFALDEIETLMTGDDQEIEVRPAA